jgi:hypothetical protein
MDNESEKAADDFDSKEDRKQQAALLHRLLLFERGLFAALSSLDATPALKQQHEEFNGAIMKERLEQFKSKHERALNIGMLHFISSIPFILPFLLLFLFFQQLVVSCKCELV